MERTFATNGRNQILSGSIKLQFTREKKEPGGAEEIHEAGMGNCA